IDPNGVVEVASGFAVDGDHRDVAEVATAFEFLRGDDDGDGFGLFDHFGREAMRKVVLANDDFDVYAEIVRIAEDLDDTADGFLAFLGKFEQLDIDDHAVELFHGRDLARV